MLTLVLINFIKVLFNIFQPYSEAFFVAGHFTPRENYLLIDEITLTVEVFSRDSKGLVFDTDQLSHYMKKKFKEHGYAIGTGQPVSDQQ